MVGNTFHRNYLVIILQNVFPWEYDGYRSAWTINHELVLLVDSALHLFIQQNSEASRHIDMFEATSSMIPNRMESVYSVGGTSITLPETNSSPLKRDRSKRNFIFQPFIFSGRTWYFQEGYVLSARFRHLQHPQLFPPFDPNHPNPRKTRDLQAESESLFGKWSTIVWDHPGGIRDSGRSNEIWRNFTGNEAKELNPHAERKQTSGRQKASCKPSKKHKEHHNRINFIWHHVIVFHLWLIWKRGEIGPDLLPLPSDVLRTNDD